MMEDRHDKHNVDSTVLLSIMLKKMMDIEKKLEGRVAYLPVEDAVDIFWQYLLPKKAPRGYKYMLDLFVAEFQGRNIAEISAEEVERFLHKWWGDKSATTMRVRYDQLTGLFNYSSLSLQRRGSPAFQNPMAFITGPEASQTPPVFLSVETMGATIAEAKLPTQRLLMAILATTGMRVGELIKLIPDDVDGDVIRIREPKSGRDGEFAVIPSSLVLPLKDRISATTSYIFPRYTTIYEVVTRCSLKQGHKFSPHYFRKWVATYWDRQGDYGMANAVLRHKQSIGRTSTPSLRGVYIAPLSVDEMRERQNKIERILKIKEAIW